MSTPDNKFFSGILGCQQCHHEWEGNITGELETCDWCGGSARILQEGTSMERMLRVWKEEHAHATTTDATESQPTHTDKDCHTRTIETGMIFACDRCGTHLASAQAECHRCEWEGSL